MGLRARAPNRIFGASPLALLSVSAHAPESAFGIQRQLPGQWICLTLRHCPRVSSALTSNFAASTFVLTDMTVDLRTREAPVWPQTAADTARGTVDQPVVYKGAARPHRTSLLAGMRQRPRADLTRLSRLFRLSASTTGTRTGFLYTGTPLHAGQAVIAATPPQRP